jgi:predicted MFS family arabinose efflux permease
MRQQNFISGRERQALFLMVGLGVIGVVYGVYAEDLRLWPTILLNAFFFLTLTLGAAVFVAINRVANAGWYTALRRVPEAMMSYLPISAISMLALFFGVQTLFEWSHQTFEYNGVPLTFKNNYLSVTFFFGRMAVFFAIWILLTRLIASESRKQDVDSDVAHTRKAKTYSAIFLVLFAFTFTFASFDWLMSLEPLFYSTIFAFYVISGLLLTGFAAITLFTILLQQRGLLPQVNETHLHSLGKLVFGFSTFWAYIWLSQYLLIYYANLPEETIYYLRRMQSPGWKFLFFANIFLNWVIPFVLLLSRSAKRGQMILVTACVIVLAGHWVDLYVMIFPVFEHSPMLGFVDVAVLIGFASLFLQTFISAFKRAAPVPLKDPYLDESLWQVTPEAPDPMVWTPAMKKALGLSTVGFALTFAVWGLIGALAPRFRELYQLSALQTSILIAVPVLLGSVGRLPMGILADRFGGRIVFGLLLVFCLVPAIGVSQTNTYPGLLFWAFFLGCAGASFSVGVAFTSKWYRPEQQGTALGIYGMGNIGQSVAVFGAPLIVVLSEDWRAPFWGFGITAAIFGLLFLWLARDATVQAKPKRAACLGFVSLLFPDLRRVCRAGHLSAHTSEGHFWTDPN